MLHSPIFLTPYQGSHTVYYNHYPSSFGEVLLFVTSQGICGLHFLVEDLAVHLEVIEKKFGSIPHRSPKQVDPWWNALHTAGREVSVVIHGTPFQAQVWHSLCTIPSGETRSYHCIAQQLGKKKGARAVARACAQNVVAWLIPCHRVIRRDGQISGYRWGVQIKKALLMEEKASLFT